MSDLFNRAGAQPAGAYFDIARLADGRFCVQFMKHGSAPRTSYTAGLTDVMKQIQRAGRLPVHTLDVELQRACRDQEIELLT